MKCSQTVDVRTLFCGHWLLWMRKRKKEKHSLLFRLDRRGPSGSVEPVERKDKWCESSSLNPEGHHYLSSPPKGPWASQRQTKLLKVSEYTVSAMMSESSTLQGLSSCLFSPSLVKLNFTVSSVTNEWNNLQRILKTRKFSNHSAVNLEKLISKVSVLVALAQIQVV